MPEFYQTCPRKTLTFETKALHVLLLIFSGVCSDFQRFCEGFQRFCPDFHGFCSDFHQIKTFGGALAPPAPPPPAPVVARKDTPSCSQHVSFSPFIVDSPKLKNVYLRRDRLDRTDDFDVFELFGQHTRRESTDWSSPHTSLVRSVLSANLLPLCRIESPFNRTNREEEDSNLTEAQL